MERYEPPEDPNNEPTQLASSSGGPADTGTGSAYTAYGSEQQDYPSAYPEPVGQPPAPPAPPAPPPTPWYLRPAAMIGWGVLSAILITVLVWSMVRLLSKEPGHTSPATTSVTSVTSTPSSATMSSVTPSTAETTEAPATTGPAAPATTTSESPSESSQTTTPTAAQTEAPATGTTTGAPTATTTEAPATTTAGSAIHLPSQIVIPLPPGL